MINYKIHSNFQNFYNWTHFPTKLYDFQTDADPLSRWMGFLLSSGFRSDGGNLSSSALPPVNGSSNFFETDLHAVGPTAIHFFSIIINSFWASAWASPVSCTLNKMQKKEGQLFVAFTIPTTILFYFHLLIFIYKHIYLYLDMMLFCTCRSWTVFFWTSY